MAEVKSVERAEIAGKRVIVRCDLDVLDEKTGDVIDARLQAAVPTLKLLHDKGATQIIVIGHAGRPEGKVVESLKIAPIATRLKQLAGVELEVKENLRFDSREEANDESFAKELAMLGDIFVNESFASAHRAHASVVGIPKFLPSYAGLQFVSEIDHLTSALTPPPNSLAIIGGAKFETKAPLIEKLLQKYAQLLLGGALGNDVIKARGMPVGASLVSKVVPAADVAGDERVVVANDCVVRESSTNAERTALVADIQAAEAIVDVGPATAQTWAAQIKNAPFVLWNGPMGVYEDGFVDGTDVLAEAIATAQCKAVVGGGDTIAALQKFTFDESRVFVSTGGGAMLEFLTDGTLPAIEALKQ